MEIMFIMVFMMVVVGWDQLIFSFGIFILILMSKMFQVYSLSLSCSWIMSSSFGVVLMFLTGGLCFLSFISNWKEKSWSYLMLVLLLGISLMFVFSSNNYLMFYFFFEMSLIPTLMLIVGWGYQPERLISGLYMMLYTVGASFPLLICLVKVFKVTGSFHTMSILSINVFYSSMMCLLMYLAFLVKLPLYGFHLWLPKAHVEAPLVGSMMLAGVLLKLGGYGLWYISLLINFNNVCLLSYTITSMAMWGGLLASFMCLRQVDVKSFVAYSSVAHMGLVISGVMMNSCWGISSSLILMFTHGFTSSCMFVMAYITYEKVKTRSFSFMRGFLMVYPVLAFWWFFSCAMNMAVPPFLNLLGELFIVPCLFMAGVLLVVIMSMMIFMSACYNMYLYTAVNHGEINQLVHPGDSFKDSQAMAVLSHFLPMVFILMVKVFFILVAFYYMK